MAKSSFRAASEIWHRVRSAATSVIIPLLNEHRKCNRHPQIRESCGLPRSQCRPIVILCGAERTVFNGHTTVPQSLTDYRADSARMNCMRTDVRRTVSEEGNIVALCRR